MDKKIIAFGASNSKKSINKILANYVANQVPNSKVELLDLNHFEMPIYSIDRQNEFGIPEEASLFLAKIRESDGIVISFAEHNGAYSVAFKNIFDWASREEKNVWMNKPMLLLSTSPGSGGAKMVLEIASQKFSFMSSNKVFSCSVANFNENFTLEQGILDEGIALHIKNIVKEFNSLL